jgi:hypothetical protein
MPESPTPAAAMDWEPSDPDKDAAFPLVKTPRMAWRVQPPTEWEPTEDDDEPTLRTELPRLLAESIHDEVLAAPKVPPPSQSGVVLKGGTGDHSTEYALRPVSERELLLEDMLPELEYAAELEALPELEIADEPARPIGFLERLRAAIVRVLASASIVLLVIAAFQEHYCEELEAAVRMLVASHLPTGKASEPAPRWVDRHSERAQLPTLPAIRVAFRPRIPPRAGIIREVPF